jgi:hypothetical protein
LIIEVGFYFSKSTAIVNVPFNRPNNAFAGVAIGALRSTNFHANTFSYNNHRFGYICFLIAGYVCKIEKRTDENK